MKWKFQFLFHYYLKLLHLQVIILLYDEITTDTFVVTKEEVHFCFKNLEVCRKRALSIIDALEKSTKNNNDKIPDNVIVFEDKEYTL